MTTKELAEKAAEFLGEDTIERIVNGKLFPFPPLLLQLQHGKVHEDGGC